MTAGNSFFTWRSNMLPDCLCELFVKYLIYIKYLSSNRPVYNSYSVVRSVTGRCNYINEIWFNLNPSFFFLHLLTSLLREHWERKPKSCFKEFWRILNIQLPIKPAKHIFSKSRLAITRALNLLRLRSDQPLIWGFVSTSTEATHSFWCSQQSIKNNDFIQSSSVHNIFADFVLKIQEYWIEFICIN